METSDWINLCGAVCGVIMVLGGIVLLGMGAIKLADAAEKGSMTIEFRRELKITTSYPALGIFLIGWLFVGLAMFMAKPNQVHSLDIVGKLDIDDPSRVTVDVLPEISVIKPDRNGEFYASLAGDFRYVRVTIVAAGYNPETETVNLLVDKGNKLNPKELSKLGKLKFTKVVLTKPATGSVIPVPPNLASVEKAGGY
jgi:hypothetical protein